MNVKLHCCDEDPIFEIDYEVGTSYLVCYTCLKKDYFVRGIRTKKEIN